MWKLAFFILHNFFYFFIFSSNSSFLCKTARVTKADVVPLFTHFLAQLRGLCLKKLYESLADFFDFVVF